MKKTRAMMVLLAVATACAACNGSGEMSPEEQAKMKEGFAQKNGLDVSKMTPEQKAGYERWRNSGNTAPTANASASGGSR